MDEGSGGMSQIDELARLNPVYARNNLLYKLPAMTMKEPADHRNSDEYKSFVNIFSGGDGSVLLNPPLPCCLASFLARRRLAPCVT